MEKKWIQKIRYSRLRIRSALLFLQVLLPFGLYASLQMGWPLPAGLSAGAFVLSMGVMVWLG